MASSIPHARKTIEKICVLLEEGNVSSEKAARMLRSVVEQYMHKDPGPGKQRPEPAANDQVRALEDELGIGAETQDVAHG